MTALRTHPPTPFHQTQPNPHETATEGRIATRPCRGRDERPTSAGTRTPPRPLPGKRARPGESETAGAERLANRRGWREGGRRSGAPRRGPLANSGRGEQLLERGPARVLLQE